MTSSAADIHKKKHLIVPDIPRTREDIRVFPDDAAPSVSPPNKAWPGWKPKSIDVDGGTAAQTAN
jgi:hypothetical protein